jgi:hypothetical protein
MRISRLALCGLAAAVMLNASVVRADIRTSNGVVYITNEISDQDAIQFEKQLPELVNRNWFTVNLDSLGGSVAAAIRIGGLVRKFDGSTSIPKNGRCYSSCALIFIAGRQRHSLGELGLHRPYLAAQPLGRDAISQQLPKLFEIVKSYVSEMGVGDLFFQQMMNTEPAALIRYRNDEFKRLFPVTDPVYDEERVAYVARMHGLTTSEVRKREQQSEQICPPYWESNGSFEDWIDCGDAVLWGLSKPLLLERRDRAKRACDFNEKQEFNDQDRAIFDKTRLLLAWDLPFVRRHNDCVREVMLGR